VALVREMRKGREGVKRTVRPLLSHSSPPYHDNHSTRESSYIICPRLPKKRLCTLLVNPASDLSISLNTLHTLSLRNPFLPGLLCGRLVGARHVSNTPSIGILPRNSLFVMNSSQLIACVMLIAKEEENAASLFQSPTVAGEPGHVSHTLPISSHLD